MSCNNINDCNNPNLNSCQNPCRVSQLNSTTCESLPSQIENFTTQFFGIVQKTEVDGVITWVLPCNLDIGLPANPRAEDEGLACYFLRLFEQGIVGLKGDKGNPGTPGQPGANSYTVTLSSFTHPSLGSPNLTLFTAYNPAIVQNEYAFVQGSGWYLVNGTDGAGTLFLTLVAEIPGAGGVLTAGKLVVPCGPPGQSIVGPQGIQGPVGPVGPAATNVTATNGFFFNAAGSDFSVPNAAAIIDFTNLQATVLLPEAGVYQIFAIVNWENTGGSPAGGDNIQFKMVNMTAVADIAGTLQRRKGLNTSPHGQCVLQALVTVTVATQIGIYAWTNSAASFIVPPDTASITYARLA